MRTCRLEITRGLSSLFVLLLLAACSGGGGGGETNVSPQTPTPTLKMTIWQLPSQSSGQMMSYVVESDSGQLVVIDGGYSWDADYLETFLSGRPVDAWFITHIHSDHVNALTELLTRHVPPPIAKVYWVEVDRSWLEAQEPLYLHGYDNFLQAVRYSGIPLRSLSKGEHVNAGGRDWEVLSGSNPELPGLNNSSLVLKVQDPQTVLFLADLKPESGDKLLADNPTKLHARVVQMSHHGNTGVRQSFYEAVHPEICLWPTTDWLWNNDSGHGYDSGPWTTLETRQWMSAMGVQTNLVQADGLQGLILFSDGTFSVVKP